MKTIDFTSDTTTCPTSAMRQAMASAEVGDDVQGQDPTVNKLEAYVAELFGKEAAVYVPSGSMANQIAIKAHCEPGESVVVEENSHCMINEAGAAAALAGVQFQIVPFGWEEAATREAGRRTQDIHAAMPSLLLLENTHNAAGGAARSPEEVGAVTAIARDLGLKTHCDGARIWNAAVATNTSEKALVEGFDSVACCFSKGLGAPVGSALVGDREFIQKARRIRKMFGGGMRQAGVIAAGAMYALENHRSRLGDDHRRAAELRQGLRSIDDSIEFKEQQRPTNMVYFRSSRRRGGELVAMAEREYGLKFYHVGQDWIRLVTHLHIEDAQVADALDRFGRLLS